MYKNPGITDDVSLAVSALRSANVVAIPTETVYGLAALARDPDAVEKVFVIKGRPRSHPLIVHVASLEVATLWGQFNHEALVLAEHFWPGPLTLLVPRTSIVPDWVTGGRDTVAIRVPNHPLTLQLLLELNDGVVAPSANKFGKVSPTTAEHVQQDLGSDVQLILDGGLCDIGVESTIIECLDEVSILRPGAITPLDVEKTLGLNVLSSMTGPSRAPGMLASHYAPNARVVLCSTSEEASLLAQECVDKQLKTFIIDEPNLATYAHNLYALLRRADEDKCDVVLAVEAPNYGIGIAINDRLAKASAQRD
jgi:L-threonylcarbamoyladenylate synthase